MCWVVRPLPRLEHRVCGGSMATIGSPLIADALPAFRVGFSERVILTGGRPGRVEPGSCKSSATASDPHAYPVMVYVHLCRATRAPPPGPPVGPTGGGRGGAGRGGGGQHPDPKRRPPRGAAAVPRARREEARRGLQRRLAAEMAPAAARRQKKKLGLEINMCMCLYMYMCVHDNMNRCPRECMYACQYISPHMLACLRARMFSICIDARVNACMHVSTYARIC